MPVYRYKNKEGEVFEFNIPMKERDNLKGYVRIPSFPSEIRTEANSESLVDGQRKHDPTYKKALDIANLEVDLANAKDNHTRSIIKDEIKTKRKE